MSERYDEALWRHLAHEFGAFGDRAAEFLETAAQLLDGGDAPRRAEAVCYCVREALKEVPKAAGVTERPRRDQAAAAVLESRRRYDIATDGQDAASAISDLLQAIDDLALARQEEGPVHQQRLVALLAKRVGTKPAAEPIEAYQRLVARADRLAHRTATIDEARGVYAEACGLLRQLFLPPELRLPALAALAATASPTESDANRLRTLVSSPRHLDYFFDRAVSVDWLDLLDDALLVPPDGNEPWPVARLVERFKGTAAHDLATWLKAAHQRWGSAPARSWAIAHAALAIGRAGHDVALAALGTHLTTSVAHLAVRFVEQLDPADPLVGDYADLLLSPQSPLDTYTRRIVGVVLSEGIRADNWRRRVEIVLFKLCAVAREEHARLRLIGDRAGSIAEPDDLYDLDDAPSALLELLLGALGAAQAVEAALTDVLDAVDRAPDGVRERLRAWILGRYSEAPAALLVDEIAAAIATRDPTGDDVPLIDRVAATAPEGYVDAWRAALGAPPDPEVVGAALADGRVEEAWFRRRWWSAVLPDVVTSSWTKVNAILAGAYGPALREALTEPRVIEGAAGRSPLGEDELAKLPVAEAARWVAHWRPSADEWLVGSRELARVLEAVVKAAPEAWAAEPLSTVSALREPMYVAH